MPDVPIPAVPPDRMPVYALLDNIRSVWNVGSMFRTADAVALAGTVLAPEYNRRPLAAVTQGVFGKA